MAHQEVADIPAVPGNEVDNARRQAGLLHNLQEEGGDHRSFAGLLDLGYAAFFAIWAYTTGILMTRAHFSFWLTIPFAILFAAAAGVVVGGPTLRLRSDYLAIVTLGFGEIVRLTANNLNITGGPPEFSASRRWR